MNLAQRGQTLIETVIGIFILIMGITAAVGLATFALNSTANISKQLIGTALAREGVEAVRNARDTNWLQIPALDQDCYNYESPSSNNAFCYRNWQSSFYNLNPSGGSESFILDVETFAADDESYWLLNSPAGVPAPDRYKLYYDDTAASGKLYTPDNSGGKPFSGFYREIVLTEETATPYYVASIGPRLKVSSRVWWSGQRCPEAATFAAAQNSCRIELVTYLTNWRNY